MLKSRVFAARQGECACQQPAADRRYQGIAWLVGDVAGLAAG